MPHSPESDRGQHRRLDIVTGRRTAWVRAGTTWVSQGRGTCSKVGPLSQLSCAWQPREHVTARASPEPRWTLPSQLHHLDEAVGQGAGICVQTEFPLGVALSMQSRYLAIRFRFRSCFRVRLSRKAGRDDWPAVQRARSGKRQGFRPRLRPQRPPNRVGGASEGCEWPRSVAIPSEQPPGLFV